LPYPQCVLTCTAGSLSLVALAVSIAVRLTFINAAC